MVQSSLLAGEEEEWGSEGEADRASSDGSKRPSTPGEPKTSAAAAAAATVTVLPETPPPPASPAPVPKLRLNTSLATDPALRVPVPPKAEPPGSPADIEYLATLPSALQTAIVAGRLFCVPPLSATESVLSRTQDTADKQQATGPVYFCTPCAIKFSSLSTLEAHQTYYCSHRHGSQPKAVAGSSAGGVDSEPEDMKPLVEVVRDDVSGGESSTGEPAAKSAKSGKQYRCPHCSYSADKKVSLNRHMRMHSTSPVSQTGSNVETDSQHLVDRYCQDCDIRFSSLKTFKAHKMHYCSTRHVIKTKPISAPSSPSESRTTPTSPGASDTSNHHPREPPPQPFLALPTNPILIVPYSLFQGASILNGPVMGLPTQDTACLLLPDGTLQPLAQGLLAHNRIPPAQAPSEPTKRLRINSETVVKHPEESRSKNGVNETPGAPLDLSVRTREEEGDLIIDMEEEDEKENRRSVDNQANIFPSPDPEDIICAPSIPLMLSTSSTCSSPSPAPPSPALSSSSYSTSNRKPQETKRQRTDSQSSSPSPKSSPSGAKSPRRTPNGLLNASEKAFKSSDPKRKSSSDSVSPPKLDNTNNNLTLSSLLLAAAAQGQIEGFPGKTEGGLPFPPELVSHLAASRLGGNKGKPIPAIPGLIPAAGRNLPLLLPKPPRTPSDLMNPATILPLLTSEMALRIAAGADPAVGAPQVLVKQGVSKCLECNIVFCKHENYVAHKKHYCSARQLSDPVIVQDDDIKPASPAMSCSPPNTASPPTSLKDQAHSPVNSAGLVTPATSVSKPTLYQFICAACGIKFTSYDNLSAHQAYYCPKRSSTENEKGSRRCSKCKLTVPMDHICGGGGAWKCPCCPVVSPTASAAQKHMDTHTGVKAFLCTICRYKGNTLRGMRTHIRMHFEKRSAEIMEENYITCLLEDGSGGNIEIPAVDPEDNHIRKTPESNNIRSMNGASVKVKEEVERRAGEEEDDEYIEVEEVNIKTEPQVKSQDCNESKNVVLRRGESVLSNVTRSLQVQR